MTDYKKQLMLFTQNLKTTRKDYHITQKEIADRLGFTQSAFSQFECGHIDSYVMILKYGDCLNQIIEERYNV